MSDWERAAHAAHSIFALICLFFQSYFVFFSLALSWIEAGKKTAAISCRSLKRELHKCASSNDGDDEAKHKWGEATTRAWFPIHYPLSPAQPQHYPCFNNRIFLGMMKFINFRKVYFLIFPDNEDDIERHEIYVSHPPLPIASQAATPPLFQASTFPGHNEFYPGKVLAFP